MNNNFSFNYTPPENNDEKLVEVTKIEEPNIYNSKSNDKDEIKDKRNKNIFILVFGIIAMIVLFVVYGLKSNGLKSLSEELNNINNSEEKDIVKNNEIIYLNDEYIIEAKINYKIDNLEYKYTYTISKEDDIIYIAKEYNDLVDKYIYSNNEYYKVTDTNEEDYKYTIINEKNIFDIIDYKYLNISNINNYITLATKQYTTNHSNNTKEIKYNVLLSDILYKNISLEYIEILYKYNNTYNIDINYTNLIKKYNDKYEDFNVSLYIVNS